MFLKSLQKIIHFWKELSNEERFSLEVPFGEDEVKEDVWSNARDKSPGIGGFNFYFFKESWDILKDSIINFLNEFYSNTGLQKVVTYLFLALIPKFDSPISVEDYRLEILF